MNREQRRELAKKIILLERDSLKHKNNVSKNMEEIENLIKDCDLTDLLEIDEYIMNKKV